MQGIASLEQNVSPKNETFKFIIPSHLWQVQIVRTMPVEVFELLKLTILRGDYGIVLKNTKCVKQLQITKAEAAMKWMVGVINKNNFYS